MCGPGDIGIRIMADTLDPLVLDFLEWLAREPRPYAEVMDVWRTSCPRLTVWEDSVDRGFVTRGLPGHSTGQQSAIVGLTPSGFSFLSQHGRHLPGGWVICIHRTFDQL
jgi:hypothetical protein